MEGGRKRAGEGTNSNMFAIQNVCFLIIHSKYRGMSTYSQLRYSSQFNSNTFTQLLRCLLTLHFDISKPSAHLPRLNTWRHKEQLSYVETGHKTKTYCFRTTKGRTYTRLVILKMECILRVRDAGVKVTRLILRNCSRDFWLSAWFFACGWCVGPWGNRSPGGKGTCGVGGTQEEVLFLLSSTLLAGTLNKVPVVWHISYSTIISLPSVNKPNPSDLFLTLEIAKGTAGRGTLYFIYSSKTQKTVFREKRSKSLY